jgi:hypothetical protein
MNHVGVTYKFNNRLLIMLLAQAPNKSEDYRIDTGEDQHAVFTLLRGEFEGIKYRYIQLRVKESDATGATIQFEYEVVKGSLEHTKDDLEQNPDFEAAIGQVLHDVLMAAAETVEEFNDNRKDDSKKSGAKQRVRKTRAPVSET